MAYIGLDNQQFYQPPAAKPSSKTRWVPSWDPKTTLIAATDPRPLEGALTPDKDEKSAVTDIVEPFLTARLDQVSHGSSENISPCILYRDNVPDFADANSISDTELPSIEEIFSALEYWEDVVSPDTGEASVLKRHNSTVEFGRSGSGRSRDNPILLDLHGPNEKTDSNFSCAGFEHECSSPTSLSGCRGADKWIPIALSGLRSTPDCPVFEQNATKANKTPLITSFETTALEEDIGSCHNTDAWEGRSEREDPWSGSRAGQRGDKRSRSCNRNIKNYGANAGTESGNKENRSHSNEDSEDDDYTDDSSGPGSDSGGQPPPPKRRRRGECTDHSLATVSPASKEPSHASCADGSSQKTEAASLTTVGESEEIRINGVLKLKTVGSQVVYCLTFTQAPLQCLQETRSRRNVIKSESRGGGKRRSYRRECATGSTNRRCPFSAEDDVLLVKLKEEDCLPWENIAGHFPNRTKGTLQMRYYTKLRRQ